MPSFHNRPCESERGFSNISEWEKEYAKRRRRRVRNAAKRKKIIWCLCMSCETAPSSLNTLHRRKKKNRKGFSAKLPGQKNARFTTFPGSKKFFSSKRAYCRVLAAWPAMQKLIFTHSSFLDTKKNENIVPLPLSDIYLFPPHDDDCV